jgi:hypothetical protein
MDCPHDVVFMEEICLPCAVILIFGAYPLTCLEKMAECYLLPVYPELIPFGFFVDVAQFDAHLLKHLLVLFQWGGEIDEFLGNQARFRKGD